MRKNLFKILVAFMIFVSVKATKVSADTITREIPLGGWSYYMDKFYSNGGQLFDNEEVELLANVMYHENYYNGDYVMLLTGSVVLNRVKASWYPNTIKDVIYQKGQYATVPKFFTKPIPDRVYWLAKRLLLFGSLRDDIIFQSMYPHLGKVVIEINGEYFAK